MKFAEGVKSEGVVNTNEDGKAVQTDLGEEPRQETVSMKEGVGQGILGPPGAVREEGRTSPGLGWGWGQPRPARGMALTGKAQGSQFSHL